MTLRLHTLFLLMALTAATASAQIHADGPPVDTDPSSVVVAGTENLIIDDGGAEISIGDGGQFIWLNRFTPPGAHFPLAIDEVSVLVPTSTGVVIGQRIEFLLYEDTDADGDPATGANLLGTLTTDIQALDVYVPYPIGPIAFNGPGDVLVGVVNRSGFEGFNDFPAGLDQTATQTRSWAATYLVGDVPVNPTLPGDEQWGLIDSFGFPGNWTVRASYNPNLPVELTAFDGLVDDHAVLLSWSTASELDNSGFEVQHRPAGEESFRALGFVAGHGTTSEAQTYSFRTDGLTPGTHTFRLMQLDFDGLYEYSPEIELTLELPGTHVLTDSYPNPFNPTTQFSLTVARDQEVAIHLYDALGQRVQTVHQGELTANTAHRFTLNAGALPSGLYIYQVTGASFTDSRRILLMK